MFLRRALLSLGTSCEVAVDVLAAAAGGAGCALLEVAVAGAPLEALDAPDDADNKPLPLAHRPC